MGEWEAHRFVGEDLDEVPQCESACLEHQLPRLLHARPSEDQQLVPGRIGDQVAELEREERIGPVITSINDFESKRPRQ